MEGGGLATIGFRFEKVVCRKSEVGSPKVDRVSRDYRKLCRLSSLDYRTSGVGLPNFLSLRIIMSRHLLE